MNQTNRPPQALQPLKPLRWPVIALSIFMVSAVTAGAAWLLLPNNDGISPLDTTRLRIEAIRTASAIGAGTGGAFALLLAVRRQWLNERAQVHAEDDAAERRLNELFIKANEQLGSDEAAVRIGALYSLERVGQHSIDYRQEVIDVLCGYLRMPFTESVIRNPSGKFTKSIPARSRAPEDSAAPYSRRNKIQQEKQVRLTAERIIQKRLDSTRAVHPETYPQPWENIDIDLTGATLIEGNFSSCNIKRAAFTGALFSNEASFRNAKFAEHASFKDATFVGCAQFYKSVFGASAEFEGVTFRGDALFISVQFRGTLNDFRFSQFKSRAIFRGARFNAAEFYSTRFRSEATFASCVFSIRPNFFQVEQHDDIDFKGSVVKMTAPRVRSFPGDDGSPQLPTKWTITPAPSTESVRNAEGDQWGDIVSAKQVNMTQ